MTKLIFGEWLPDRTGLFSDLSDAKNVVAQQIGYGPIPKAVQISKTSAPDKTLSSLYAAKSPYGGTILFAAGNTNVYIVSADGDLNDISGEVYTSDDRVRFTQFGSNILFTNNSQPIQSYLIGSSNKFGDLSNEAPIAKYITVVRDFVVVANTYEEEQKQYRVRWSDFNNEAVWTTSDTTQADFQDLADGGQIMGIRGGEFGLVFLERGIYRMTYVGTPFIFQFDNISRGKGCISSGSIIQYQGVSFFLSDDGFYMCDGQQVTPIGAEKIDRWFFDNADQGELHNMSASIDPMKKTIIWNFKGVTGDYRQLIYSFKVGRWTNSDQQIEFIGETSSSSEFTIEDLDSISNSIDDLQTSLDSVIYLGGRFFLGGTKNGAVYSFIGQNLTGQIISGDIDAGFHSVITLARPQVDGGSGAVAVASRGLLSEVPTFGALVEADAENRVPLRSAGRYHRLKLVPTGDNWNTAVAVEYDIVGQGVR